MESPPADTRRQATRGAALAALAALLFGASTPASKLLLASLSPFQLAGLLYLGAALAVAPGVLRERRLGDRVALDRANLARLAGAVVAGGLLGPVCLLVALRSSGAGSVSLLLNLELVATAVLGVLWFGEHLGRLAWCGVAGATLAGAWLAADGGWPGVAAAALVALACTCWGLDNHLTALVDGITPARSTLVKGSVAGAVNLALGLSLAPWRADAATLAAALGVGALAYGASIALSIAAAQELGATRAQTIFSSAPFAGAALAYGWLGEPLGAATLAAAALLALSIAALLGAQHGHAHSHEALVHVHSHRHDDGHHHHAHPGSPRSLRHSHVHRHEPLRHAHPHWPDVHHRHRHARGER